MPLTPEQRRQILEQDALPYDRANLSHAEVRRRAMDVIAGKVERALLDHSVNSNIEPPDKKTE